MILRLLIWVILFLGGGATLLAGGRAVVRRLRPWRERRQLASRNARLLEEELKVRCVYCNGRTPPPQLFEDKTGWYHQSCYLRIVDDL